MSRSRDVAQILGKTDATNTGNLALLSSSLDSAEAITLITGHSSNLDSADMQTISAQVSGNRNLIINGAMQVAQKGTSFTGHGAGVNYGIDRFFDFHSSDGAFTLSQETSVVPVGFGNALKVQTTTADSSIAAGQRLIVGQRLEGLNVSHLNWGTSNAQTVTLSFYVRSSVTGTHGGAIGNGSDNRNYPFTYTISSADTWERKTITIPGDQTGTWATTSARSLQVIWGLGVGSTYSGSAGAWAAGDKNSATGATTDVLGTLNATWYLTGVQLEVGDIATAFEHEDYATTLIKGQRYYQSMDYYFSSGSTSSNPYYYTPLCFPVTMRAAPAMTASQWGQNTGNASTYHGSTAVNGWVLVSAAPTAVIVRGNHTNAYNLLAGRGKFDAEL
jgi:hypothetical protein